MNKKFIDVISTQKPNKENHRQFLIKSENNFIMVGGLQSNSITIMFLNGKQKFINYLELPKSLGILNNLLIIKCKNFHRTILVFAVK